MFNIGTAKVKHFVLSNKRNFVEFVSLVALASVVLTGSSITSFRLTGNNSSTGQGDILVENRVMSQAEYDSNYSNDPYAFDGFVYTDALNLQLRFQSNEELEGFTSDLKHLQNKEVSLALKKKFAGEHIIYDNKKISTEEFTELHRDNKAIWVKCYLPNELLTGDIKAFDSEEQFRADATDC